ncbi:hypothetical protein FA15DRAFT_670074 [Coprinopsis marcescibilis]|uniref:TPR-like protein n=1 Tax=Coprinopsis marcescibilis TaxID=230819 RepID=A0A5C3KTX2_COPMA|nr:hypothetical protein FA15DRAFT_670074 [Coprinopsis marcescibilis]
MGEPRDDDCPESSTLTDTQFIPSDVLNDYDSIHFVKRLFSQPSQGLPTLDVIARAAEDADNNQRLDKIYLQILSHQLGADTSAVELYQTVFGAIISLQEPLSSKGLASLYAPEGITESKVDDICARLGPFLGQHGADGTHSPISIVHPSLSGFLTERAPPPYRLDPPLHRAMLSRVSLLVIRDKLNQENVPALGYSEGDWTIFEIPDIIPLAKSDVAEEIRYSCSYLSEHADGISTTPNEEELQLLRDAIFSDPRRILELTSSLGKVIDIDLLLRLLSIVQPMQPSAALALKKTLAQALYSISNCLEEGMRHEEALRASKAAASLYRDIIESTGEDNLKVLEDLVFSLRVVSRCLSELARHDDCLLNSEEAVKVARRLASLDPTRFNTVLATALRNLSYALSKHQRHKEAVDLSQEAIDITRPLAVSDPSKYNVSLAASLYSLAYHQDSRRSYKESIAPISESTEIYRRQISATPNPTPNMESLLAGALHNYAVFLANLDRIQESATFSEEALSIRRRITARVPSKMKFEADLARSLYCLASDYHVLGRGEDSLVAIEESIQIRRRLAIQNPHSFEATLADSLHDRAFYLGELGRVQEGITVGLEAIAIRRRLIEAPAIVDSVNRLVLEAELARSLHNLAEDYSACGDTENALLAVAEATEVRKRVVADDPDDLDAASALAYSIRNSATYLSQMNRHDGVVGLLKEAAALRQKLVKTNHAKHESEYFNALSLFVQSCDEMKCWEEGLEPLEEAIDVYRGLMDKTAGYDHPGTFDRYQLRLIRSLRNYAWLLVMMGEYDQAMVPSHEVCRTLREHQLIGTLDDINEPYLMGLFEHMRRLKALRSSKKRDEVEGNGGRIGEPASSTNDAVH